LVRFFLNYKLEPLSLVIGSPPPINGLCFPNKLSNNAHLMVGVQRYFWITIIFFKKYLSYDLIRIFFLISDFFRYISLNIWLVNMKSVSTSYFFIFLVSCIWTSNIKISHLLFFIFFLSIQLFHKLFICLCIFLELSVLYVSYISASE
jgi:hypothetical protein